MLRFASFYCLFLLRFASFYFVLIRFAFTERFVGSLFASFCFVLRLPLLFHHLCNVSCHFMTSGPCVAHVLDMTSLFFLRPPVCICRLVAPWGLCAKQSPTWSIHTGLALGQAMWHEASMKPTSPEVRIALELVGLRTPPSGQFGPRPSMPTSALAQEPLGLMRLFPEGTGPCCFDSTPGHVLSSRSTFSIYLNE